MLRHLLLILPIVSFPAFTANAGEANPALLPFLPDSSRTVATVFADHLDAGDTNPVQEGTGHTLGRISAETFRRIGRNAAVHGDASFTFGKIRDIRWNNCADFDLVAPYVLGDSVGGDLSRKAYAFSGAYAASIGRWSWGAEAAYRAQIDYRGRDPRLRIIVSDLDITAGGSYSFPVVRIGLSAGLRVYNQTSDLTFYNPLNDIRTYALTGLGSYYPRFSGNSSENTAYQGIGWTAGVQLRQAFGQSGDNAPAEVPAQSDNGLSYSADLSASGITISQILRDFNNLTLAKTANFVFGGNARISKGFGSWRGGAELEGFLRSKNGTENLFGSSSGNRYEVIGSRKNYTLSEFRLRLSLPFVFYAGANEFGVRGAVGYDQRTEKLVSPRRELSSETITPELQLNWNRTLSGHRSLGVELGGSYASARKVKEELTGLNLGYDLTTALLRDFALRTADRTNLGARAWFSFPLRSSIGMTVAAGYAYASCAGFAGKGNSANIALSVTF